MTDGILSVGYCYDAVGSYTNRVFTTDDIVHSDDLSITFAHCPPHGVQHRCELTVEEETGVCRRTDRITNAGPYPTKVHNPSLSFVLSAKAPHVICQESRWCAESQPAQLMLGSAPVGIGSKGRTCSGYAPYFRVESDSFGQVVFHVLPAGDWRATFRRTEGEDGVEIAVDRGDGASVQLEPNEVFEVGLDCLVQVSGDAFSDARHIQVYALNNLAKRRIRALPVVYNTWFDCFHKISIPRMLAQLDAAAEVGCEVFVVDAGWYGAADKEWHGSVGDWRENPGVFGEMTLARFAEQVRAKGLDFGLWIEPERVGSDAPILKEHPDWFIGNDMKGFFYPDLLQLAARNWVLSEMSRLVESYQLKWIKIDCNTDFSDDPHGMGHLKRMEAWYEILDRLSERFPHLVMEGCASGGLRNDLLTTSHFHTHFLSDTVDPVDCIRIGFPSHLRLPPAMVARWAVIYPTGGGFTTYGHDAGDCGDLVLCPATATADRVGSYHLDFAMRAAMPGAMGLSGNLAGLDPGMRKALSEHIEYYKTNRDFICSAIAVPLTALEPLTKRDGIAVLQLLAPDCSRAMIFIYNIASDERAVQVRPRLLNGAALYNILGETGLFVSNQMTGSDIMEQGIIVDCSSGHAGVLILEQSAAGTPNQQH